MESHKQIKIIADAYRQMKVDEARLTPEREKVLNKTDADAADALHASVGSTDPKVKERAHTELGKSLRAEILRQMAKPKDKRTGAWAGASDADLKIHLKAAAKKK